MYRYLLLFVVCIAIVPTATAAAPSQVQTVDNQTTAPQEETPTATPSPPTDGTLFPGDPTLRILDWSYSDGQFTITFAADVPRRLTFTSVEDGARGLSSGTVTTRSIPAGESTLTVSTATPTVWISSPISVNNGKFAQISASDGFFISGPWDGSDVRNAGIGGALGVVIAVLYEAVSAKVGSSERGERVA